jgi:DNA-binding transcriptional LysR family regulator
MDIELRHLRSFVVVAEELNFTRAADVLLMTQPNLTRIINKLEKALGVQLLDRTTRRVALTPRGAQLKADLDVALGSLDQALATCRTPTSLRLGFTWLLHDDWSAHVVTRFERTTGVRVDLLRREDIVDALDRGEVDLAVVRDPVLPAEGLRALPLFRERRMLAVSRHHPVARRDTVRWNEFADWPIVVNTVSGVTHPDLWEPRHRPPVAMTCLNFDEWLEAVAAGRGVGVIPETAARRGLHSAVRFVEIEDAPPIEVHLVYPERGHELVHRFAETARDAGGPPFGQVRVDDSRVGA